MNIWELTTVSSVQGNLWKSGNTENEEMCGECDLKKKLLLIYIIIARGGKSEQ
jgi:hypothetical protein